MFLSLENLPPFNYLRTGPYYILRTLQVIVTIIYLTILKSICLSLFSTNNHFRIPNSISQEWLKNPPSFLHGTIVETRMYFIMTWFGVSMKKEHTHWSDFIKPWTCPWMKLYWIKTEASKWEDMKLNNEKIKELNKEHFHPFRAIWCITSTGQIPDFMVWLRFHINGGDCYKINK